MVNFDERIFSPFGIAVVFACALFGYGWARCSRSDMTWFQRFSIRMYHNGNLLTRLSLPMWRFPREAISCCAPRRSYQPAEKKGAGLWHEIHTFLHHLHRLNRMKAHPQLSGSAKARRLACLFYRQIVYHQTKRALTLWTSHNEHCDRSNFTTMLAALRRFG